MITLNVDLGPRSYPIYIGTGLLGRADLVVPYVSGKQVLIVTNETIAPLYLAKAQSAFNSFNHKEVILPDGEQYKTLETVNTIFNELLSNHFDRNCTLVALGGGVIGDMTGFAAACYQRGVNFIQIPTTLLSQVDSSVGGKTGVNHPLGKNMIGAFHQPRCVIADTDTLLTLDDRQLRSGLAEVIKYGLINDPEFFEWLEHNINALLERDSDALAYAIERSCADKSNVVAADERESNSRALLNLGHTFGHAIETGMGYGEWLHGEAIATGILLAAELSERKGWMTSSETERVRALLGQAGLPLEPPSDLDGKQFLELMAVDKKVIDGRLRLILMKGIGKSVITDEATAAEIAATVDGHR